MKVKLFLVFFFKVKKWSTKWYAADVYSATNPIKVPYIVSSRILIVSNLGTTWERVEIGETTCFAARRGSAIQLFSIISCTWAISFAAKVVATRSLSRWFPHVWWTWRRKITCCYRAVDKKSRVCFYLIKYCIRQEFSAVDFIFHFLTPAYPLPYPALPLLPARC